MTAYEMRSSDCSSDVCSSDLIDPTEFTLNRALQRSNLGEFAEAERLFAEVEAIPTGDPVQLRLRRNFRAINALNQRDYDRAAALLRAPVAPIATGVTVAGDEIGRAHV